MTHSPPPVDVLTHMSAYEAPPYFATVPSCVRVPNTPTQPLRLRHLAIVARPRKVFLQLSSPASSDRISPQLIGAITATAILAFLGLFLETVLNVLFPALMSDFSVTMADVQWMTSGYLLVVSIVMPITGWLQRRFTPRSLFLTAAGSILTGALIAALAPRTLSC